MEEEIERKPTDIDIKGWAEGNEHLENLLISCRENGIPSMFCCAGHSDDKPAYIVFKMNNQTITRVYSIVNCLNNTKDVSISFSRNPLFNDSKFIVYMHNEVEKNSIMDSMSKAICEKQKFENLPRSSQILLELAELLISNKFNFDLTYYKGEEREINFRNILIEDTNYPFDKRLEELGFVSEGKGLITKYSIQHIKDRKEQRVFKRIFKGMKNICNEFEGNKNSEYQQRVLFERILSKNGQLKGVSSSIECQSDNKGIKEIIERDKNI